MTAGLEIVAAEEWLDATLNGDATLNTLLGNHGAWNTQAPEPTAYPIVVYQFMSGIDLAVVGAFRIWTDLIYQVKAIGETADFATLGTIAARLDALLHRATGTAADGTVWACVREQVIHLPDSVAGRQYRHSGALFRIYAT